MNKQVRRRSIRRAEEMEESFMKYNFDEVIDRKGTHAMKVERLPKGSGQGFSCPLGSRYGLCLRRTDLKGSP